MTVTVGATVSPQERRVVRNVQPVVSDLIEVDRSDRVSSGRPISSSMFQVRSPAIEEVKLCRSSF